MANGRDRSWSEQAEFEEKFQDEDNDQGYSEGYSDSDYCDDDSSDLHSNLWGDFSVRAKASRSTPQFTTKRTASTAAYPHLNRNSPSKRIRHLPPEILHLIFSQVDNATLCQVSRASHQFNAITKEYFERMSAWDLGKLAEGDVLLEKMRSGSVNVLKIDCPMNWSPTTGRDQLLDTWIEAWKRFIELITEPIHNSKVPLLVANASSINHVVDATEALSLSERDSKPRCLLDRVKKVLIGDPDLPALLPYLHRIHTLEIWDQDRYIYRDLHLQPVLKACSSLDTLIIHGCYYERLWIGWSIDNNTPPEPKAWTHSLLTRISIRDVSISHDSMASLLTSCPRLTYFRVWDVHFRHPGIDSTDTALFYVNMRSLPLNLVYRQAARLRPNLQYFSASAMRPNYSDLPLGHLVLTAELFPHLKHVNLERFTMPNDDDYWCPNAVTSKFLSQLTSIEVCSAPSRVIDRILKHCRMLTCLKIRYGYKRPPPPPSSTPQSPHRSQDLPSFSWRCPQLRILELGTRSHATVQEDEAVFRFLVHACPNLEELSLHLSTLRVGQEELIVTTREEIRTVTRTTTRRRNPPSTYIETWTEEVKTEEWLGHKNIFCLLGRLAWLKRLNVHVEDVPGILYPSHFAFLGERRHDRNRDGDGMVEPFFCPHLQSLRIHNRNPITFGKARGEPLTEQQFSRTLKTIRPEECQHLESSRRIPRRTQGSDICVRVGPKVRLRNAADFDKDSDVDMSNAEKLLCPLVAGTPSTVVLPAAAAIATLSTAYSLDEGVPGTGTGFGSSSRTIETKSEKRVREAFSLTGAEINHIVVILPPPPPKDFAKRIIILKEVQDRVSRSTQRRQDKNSNPSSDVSMSYTDEASKIRTRVRGDDYDNDNEDNP
ncbi:MAG: hypothetical protein J3R72DRAFT_498201 [Linnemannia gamsii]|nr:MAG: hypothetical protein J3R72DRAFT_498201 [Linnemannia gamsii]